MDKKRKHESTTDGTVKKLVKTGYVDSPPTHVRLGRNGPQVFAYGMGTLPFGVIYPDENKRPSAEDVRSIIKEGCDRGVQFIDTADTYCRDQYDYHYVERLIGETSIVHKKGVIVGTKGGMRRAGSHAQGGWWPDKLTPEKVEKKIAASREALKIPDGKPLALWQLHHTDDLNDPQLDAVIKKLKSLADQGIISQVGLCNATLHQLKRAHSLLGDLLASCQNKFNLFERTNEKDKNKFGVVPYCQEHGIAFMPYGFLGGVSSRNGKLSFMSPGAKHLVNIANEKGVSVHALVLAWMRHKWPCTLHIVGMRSNRLDDLVRVAPTIRFTQAELDKIDNNGANVKK